MRLRMSSNRLMALYMAVVFMLGFALLPGCSHTGTAPVKASDLA